MEDKITKKILTLCIIHQNDKVLLGMKKRGFGQGRWNGFGGKIKEGESIIGAAGRELMEETGIAVRDFHHLGILNFSWKSKPEILQVYIFKADSFVGVPKETEEMRPAWFDVRDIPFEQMWQDDKHWFPLFLENKKFQGKFLFDDTDNILDYSLDLV